MHLEQWWTHCPRCDAKYIVHARAPEFRCPECGQRAKAYGCYACRTVLSPADLQAGICPGCGIEWPPKSRPVTPEVCPEPSWPPPGYWHTRPEIPRTVLPPGPGMPIRLPQSKDPAGEFRGPRKKPIHPTLLFGCGGWGLEVLEECRRLIPRDASRDLDPVRMVGIDATASPVADLDGFIHLELAGTTLSRLTSTLGDRPDLTAWFPPPAEFLPLLPQDHVQRGTAGCRPLGRLLYFWCVDQIFRTVRQQIDEMLRIRTDRRIQAHAARRPDVELEPLDVFLISSLGGGTGSGFLLDLASLVRSRTHGLGVRVHAILQAGDPASMVRSPMETERMRANTYAALKELNHIMTPGARFRARYGETLSVEADSPLDLVYLLEEGRESGAEAPAPRSLAQKVARFLGEHAAAPLSGDVASLTVDRHEAGATRARSRGTERGWASSIGMVRARIDTTSSKVQQAVIRWTERVEELLRPFEEWCRDRGRDLVELDLATLLGERHLDYIQHFFEKEAPAPQSRVRIPVPAREELQGSLRGASPVASAPELLSSPGPWNIELLTSARDWITDLESAVARWLEAEVVPWEAAASRRACSEVISTMERSMDLSGEGPAIAYAAGLLGILKMNEQRNLVLGEAHARSRTASDRRARIDDHLDRFRKRKGNKLPAGTMTPAVLCQEVTDWFRDHIESLIETAVVRVQGTLIDSIARQLGRIVDMVLRLRDVRRTLQAAAPPLDPGGLERCLDADGTLILPLGRLESSRDFCHDSPGTDSGPPLAHPSMWLGLELDRMISGIEESLVIAATTGSTKGPGTADSIPVPADARLRSMLATELLDLLETEATPCWNYLLPAGGRPPARVASWSGNCTWLVEELVRGWVAGSARARVEVVGAATWVELVQAEFGVYPGWLCTIPSLFEAYRNVLDRTRWPVHVLPGSLSHEDLGPHPYRPLPERLVRLAQALRDPHSGQPVLSDRGGSFAFWCPDPRSGTPREISLRGSASDLANRIARDAVLKGAILQRVCHALARLPREQLKALGSGGWLPPRSDTSEELGPERH